MIVLSHNLMDNHVGHSRREANETPSDAEKKHLEIIARGLAQIAFFPNYTSWEGPPLQDRRISRPQNLGSVRCGIEDQQGNFHRNRHSRRFPEAKVFHS